jgi:hypothetical protein
VGPVVAGASLDLRRVGSPSGSRAGARGCGEDRTPICSRIRRTTKGVEVVWGPRSGQKYARAEICDPNGYHIELRQWFR